MRLDVVYTTTTYLHDSVYMVMQLVSVLKKRV